MFHVYLCYNAVFSVHSSIAVTCWERADFLALLCVVFSCVLSLSHIVFLARFNLIVSFPDLCLPLYCNMSVLCQLIACTRGVSCLFEQI